MGEILAAAPLARELRKLWPGAALTVSTGTETGQALARKHFLPLGALVCYFPLDIPWAVRRYLERLRPHLIITLESEIWPNFLDLSQQRGVLLALANARMSDKSFRIFLRYRRYSLDLINKYDLLSASGGQDYQRLKELGAPAEKLHLSGNLKYDRLLQERDEAKARNFRRMLQGGQDLSAGQEPVFLAASTHPGEEEVVLAAYERLRGPYPALLLVLAPRHPERAASLAERLTNRRLAFHYWSRLLAGLEAAAIPWCWWTPSATSSAFIARRIWPLWAAASCRTAAKIFWNPRPGGYLPFMAPTWKTSAGPWKSWKRPGPG